MSNQGLAGTLGVSLAVALMAAGGGAAAADAKYPSWKGQWIPISAAGPARANETFDPTRPTGTGQDAPLTPEYQKIFKDSLSDQADGGLGNDPTGLCYAAGMPRMMSYAAQEYVITPELTYILLGGDDNLRRILTDGRAWPKTIQPTYQGYSIGHWIDEGNTGTYNVLEAETRGPFKGPRTFDSTGLPLAYDNESTFRERFFIDKANPNLLHDVITVNDHALTRPWTVDKTYRRNAEAQPEWPEFYCHVTSRWVVLGKESYKLSDDGILMPTRKGQPAPDLRYFKPAAK
jgi:hypothetical protein